MESRKAWRDLGHPSSPNLENDEESFGEMKGNIYLFNKNIVWRFDLPFTLRHGDITAVMNRGPGRPRGPGA